ncbi:MAG: hypothetical protein Fur0023_20730 [Bacteroidia bacterium]
MRYFIGLMIFATLFFVRCNSDTGKKENHSIKYLKGKDSAYYAREGAQLAKNMYAAILQKLRQALDEKGFYESVKYCNHQALPITDSLSKFYGIKAKRTSLKIRNPRNAPDSLEKQILEMYEKTGLRQPIIVEVKDSIRFFTPIFIAPFCLTCHGVPNQDIPDVTLKALNELYPNDNARNYQLYDIRGMWSISFPKNYSFPKNNLQQL